MFCKNCGTQISDDTQFCANCGTSIAQEETAAPTVESAVSEGYVAVTTAPKGNKKKLVIILSVVAAVVAVIVAFICFFSGNSPESVAEKFVIAAIERDGESLAECLPDFLLEDIADEYDIPLSKVKNGWGVREEFDYYVDDDDNVTEYEVWNVAVDEYYFDEGEKQETILRYNMNYGVEIDDICVVDVDYRVVYGREEELEDTSILCLKIDGTWYVKNKIAKY